MPPKYETIENKDMQSVTVRLKNTDAATAANYGAFFIASRPYEVMEIRAVWSSVGGASSTLNIERLTGATAEGSGDNIINTAIVLTTTANTVNEKKDIDLSNRILSTGDRLALVDAGTLTGLNNLVVTVLLKPRGRGDYR